MLRRLVVPIAAVAVLLSAQGASAGDAPKLLSYAPGDSTAFLVRPLAMSFYHSDGGGSFNYIAGANANLRTAFSSKARIRWRRWSGRAAARAAYFIVDVTGRAIRRVVTIRPWRVQHGHYTRFMIDLGREGTEVFVLKATRVRANGVPRGIPASEWRMATALKCLHHCYEP